MATSLPDQAIHNDITLQRLAALADPTRLAILALLRQQALCACHLIDELEMKQSSLAHHLRLLRSAKLVTTTPHPLDRRWIYYHINDAALEEVEQSLAWLRDSSSFDPTPRPCAADETEDTTA